MPLNRRNFVKGAALGTVLAALPFGSRIVLANTAKEPLLFVLLRGGTDGLKLVAPVDDQNLVAARNSALIPGSGFRQLVS